MYPIHERNNMTPLLEGNGGFYIEKHSLTCYYIYKTEENVKCGRRVDWGSGLGCMK